MLILKPNCEGCDCDLPPDATEAMICSYECTFCLKCVNDLLSNVCPNCGGGFTRRPVRPQTARREGISLAHQPASCERVNTSKSVSEIKAFAAEVKDIPPWQRQAIGELNFADVVTYLNHFKLRAGRAGQIH